MYFASAFAIQICTAAGCAVLCSARERGLSAPHRVGAASPGWLDPALAMAQPDPKAEWSRAACLLAWLLSTGKELLFYLI